MPRARLGRGASQEARIASPEASASGEAKCLSLSEEERLGEANFARSKLASGEAKCLSLSEEGLGDDTFARSKLLARLKDLASQEARKKRVP